METKLKQNLMQVSSSIGATPSNESMRTIERLLDGTGQTWSCKSNYRFIEATIYGRNPHDNVVHMEPNPYQEVYLLCSNTETQVLQELKTRAAEKRENGAQVFILVNGQEIGIE